MNAASRRPPLRLAIPLVATGCGALLTLAAWLQSLATARENDFHEYYVAAQLVLRRGWTAPYDLSIFRPLIKSATGVGDGFTTTPPTVVLAMPFTVLPYRPALLIWAGLLGCAALLAWRLTAPGSRPVRLLLLTSALSLWVFTFALQTANVLLLVLALVAASAWALRRGHDPAAGLLLAAAFVKPQDVLLLPLCLLILGRPRAFAWCAAGVFVLAAASVLALGPSGIQHYLATLRFESARPFYSESTLAGHLPAGAISIGVRAALGLLALWAAFRHRNRGSDAVYSAGLVGALLVTSYLNPEDLTLLVLAAWLLLRTQPAKPALAFLGAGWLVLELGNLVGSRGPIAVELVWVLGLALLPAAAVFRATTASPSRLTSTRRANQPAAAVPPA